MDEVTVELGDDLGMLEHDLGHERAGLPNIPGAPARTRKPSAQMTAPLSRRSRSDTRAGVDDVMGRRPRVLYGSDYRIFGCARPAGGR
jgi:hypothetical protein